MKKRTTHIITFLLLCSAALAQKKIYTDVLVVGGGAAGTMAGLQAARMGVSVIITEPTVWLGGMVSAAGVSAFDGNHNMPSGLWAEFREKIYAVYGGPSRVGTGWVSNTLFEPHAGDSIFKAMAALQPNLKILYQHELAKAIVKGNTITGAVLYNTKTKQQVSIYAKQVIDATELGDVMASANVPFDIGLEASSRTGENVNIPFDTTVTQDLTYVAILKDYGPLADCTLVKPTGYNPMEFDGCCNQFCSKPEKLTSNVDAKKMLDYGRLPNGKYMLNWPGHGNDSYLNIITMSPAERAEALQQAKAKTFRFIYFLQTQFGFKNLGLADDEFPTADRLALIPYHREGRRLQGLVRFKVQHISTPFATDEALYRTGIAVGDYPIDHHHRENPGVPQHLGFYPVPSYNIPLGALIPANHNGLIVAEKGISVSNVVNGTTRLQPVVMLTGQAAGVLAVLAVRQKSPARKVPVRMVQKYLLAAGAYILPYYDIKPSHPQFMAIQKIGATGLLRGTGQPYQWANRTLFYPDSLVIAAEFISNAAPFKKITGNFNTQLTIADAATIAWQLSNSHKRNGNTATILRHLKQKWKKWGLQQYNAARPITRAELAKVLDAVANPFLKKQVNHNGHYNN